MLTPCVIMMVDRATNVFGKEEGKYWSTFTWLLLGSAGCYTRPHHDATGLGTIVCVQEGFKIWLEYRRKDGSFAPESLVNFSDNDESSENLQAFYTILGPGSVKWVL